ncbi:unnamed protein product [Lactuca saligna]|uniref:Formin-like protein n=1 Tax=Lactuca saligna TaxID=75948 RepID=A0AA35YKE3_LACSI|nr:unnamed protein product [Lactuca saligna]
MKRAVSWNATVSYAKRLGYVGVFVALFCVFLVDLLEGNHWIHKKASYDNGPDWRPQYIDQNTFEQNPIANEDFNLLYFKSKTSKSNDEKQGWQEKLFKSYHCDDHDHLEKKECPIHEDPSSSPSMAKRSPIRALLTSPNELPNSYHRPSRKLIDLGGLGGSAVLIVVVVSTVVATLGVFAVVLFCCVGRDALKPGAKGQKDNKLVVDVGSKGSKTELGPSQKPTEVSDRPPKTTNLANDNHRPSETGPLPLPPGKTTLRGPGKPCRRLPGQASFQSPAPPSSPPPPPPPPAVSTPPGRKAPPSPPTIPTAPQPPPPPPGGRPAPPNPSNMKTPASGKQTQTTVNKDEKKQDGDSDSPKVKLKPFFWDKVNAVQGRSMVWHHLKDGSFQLNEETMVGLFGYVAAQNKKERNGKMESNLHPQAKLIQIIDVKKSQNLAILLRALNVTTEQVCEAVKKGTQLPVELIATLLKMAPNQEEELKLRLYNGDINQLGLSERFLKDLVEIPFAFKRLEALLFMGALHEDYHMAKESFATLEVACDKLISSRLFLRLLEAVLKTGNRMNDGTYRGGAQAFKLDTLLKLSDVKGTDGKTTLLSFVVQEIIRYEGIKVARTRGLDLTQQTPESLKKLGMEVVSKLSEELNDVKKAALIDGDNLTSTVSKLGNMMKKTKEFMSDEMTTAEGATEFNDALTRFMEYAEADITWMIEEEKRIMAMVKNTGNYFHGQSGKDEGLRLFSIVRGFLQILDTTCNEVRKTLAMQTRMEALRSPASDENGRKNKRWQKTRNRIMFMKDAVNMILEALYDDEETPRAPHDPPGLPVTCEPGQIPTPPALPSVRDKLVRLALNNQKLDDSDSDSGDWSSDDDEETYPNLTKRSSRKVDDLDADDWNLDDDDETMELGPFDFEETNPQSSTSDVENGVVIPGKQIDDSDVNGWHSDDDRIIQSQNETQHMPELPVAKESEPFDVEKTNRQSSTSDIENGVIIPVKPMDNDNGIEQSQNELQHTPELHVEEPKPFDFEEKNRQLSTSDNENGILIPVKHDSDVDGLDSDDDGIEQSQNEARHMPELPVVEEPESFDIEVTNREFSTLDFENEVLIPLKKMEDPDVDGWHSNDDGIEHSQNEARHTPKSPVVEEPESFDIEVTNRQLENEVLIPVKQMEDSDVDDWHSHDEEIEQSQNEAPHTLQLPVAEEPEPFDYEETNRQSSTSDIENEVLIPMKVMDDSDVDDWHSEDGGIDHSENETLHSPELPIAEGSEPFDFEETNRRSSTSDFENEAPIPVKRMDDSDVDDWHSDDEGIEQSQNEAQHTPESPEETSQRSSDSKDSVVDFSDANGWSAVDKILPTTIEDEQSQMGDSSIDDNESVYATP